jgi:hypothetical protein
MLNTEVSMFTFRTDVILCGLPRRQANVARAFIDHARACGDLIRQEAPRASRQARLIRGY